MAGPEALDSSDPATGDTPEPASWETATTPSPAPEAQAAKIKV
jgi:hypothetical protein